MAESFCRVGEIELCYETYGDPGQPPMLLVMGLGTQMLGWDAEFCEQLAARGFHVIRYDNRDVGRSTMLSDHAPPTLAQLIARSRRAAAYTLAEMAADGVGLLDHLGIERAHVVGASMGGMIAQTIAARRPERVLSLCSIMSSTGSRISGQPAPSTYRLFLRPIARDRERYVEQLVELFAHIGSPGFDRDERVLRATFAAMYDRGHDPAGSSRQLAAILASGNRTRELRRITAPTLVIHGTKDRLVAPSGGRATARAIPGARLLTIEGMGHDLPRALWPRLLDAIVENAARASGDRRYTPPSPAGVAQSVRAAES
jgi:pimeloyl-ACP methyl ester carboxylesterase